MESKRLGWTPIPKLQQDRILSLWELYKDVVGLEIYLNQRLEVEKDESEILKLQRLLGNRKENMSDFEKVAEELSSQNLFD